MGPEGRGAVVSQWPDPGASEYYRGFWAGIPVGAGLGITLLVLVQWLGLLP
jgi:hypothetical protein